tara:strand:+ start:464 stop:748 length:285 start_codon:yes stop_codon:yes gene_type:complete
MSDPIQRIELIVIGRVQGVFFRASTLEQAQSLNLVGFVENLPDGSVEVVAEGPKYALEDLERWCGHGPPKANVREVMTRWKDKTGEFQTFTIRR